VQLTVYTHHGVRCNLQNHHNTTPGHSESRPENNTDIPVWQ
jgi:hypothetical protein